jgi:parallel beta-helix repeat protein
LPAGQPKRVVLRPGEFFDTGVTLTAADSGLTIQSDSAGPALLLGGMALSGWEREGNHFWSARLPEGRAWDVRMLQVNGGFCPRARLPEEGTFTHASVFNVPWMSTTGGGWKRKPTDEELTTLEYKDNDVPADLDARSAEVTVFHMWDESVAGISRHANRTLKLFPPLGHPPGAFGVQKYCLWNIKEGMTRPGQWYFDRGRARIIYWPLAGEDMAKAVAIVPTQRSIIRLSGATNVTLRNLSMAITTVPLITGGFAAAAFNGAIQLESASGATISNIRISNVAGQAIRGLHQQNSTRILDCDVSNCGAGGIYLSGAHNIVSNTLVHGVGLMFPSGMGIYGGGDGCQISHNEIYDTTYSAIGLSGKQMLIENNLLSQCMKVLHDGAAGCFR